jgi:hypothetical protein
MFQQLRMTVSRAWAAWFNRPAVAPLSRSEKKRRRKQLIRKRGIRL